MNERVLIVEDEEHLAFALEFNLKAEGYVVDVAPTIARARELLRHKPAVVILDVMLPDGDGFELCAEMRRAGETTPVLFLTARGALDDVVRGLEAGGDDYMTKPFALKELMGRLAAMLRRRAWDARPDEPSPRAGAYRFGDGHEIDFEARIARARGAPVSLTELEFRVLRYFADHPQRVIGREELLANVWEISPDSNTRTVDVFVVRLRRIFERDPAQPRIFVTVRGAGYRFVPQ